ncbi:hypothetical protein CANARDRAFT_203536 [[Candida] arabinofermentans NRRL YB-2248]|uniref:NAD(+) diphosphatase n=1 Tax=[Candida] arabinofermentans NRRL YB-2248 TaxID=983967 RepID=A0A1E4SUQ8_9ASCO|nr:hypothetical protein CANARDRAFT_203536 [[Candida] arabinofermentans NRRL YB-2248]
MPLNLQDVIKSWCVKNSTGDPNIRSDVTCVFLGLDQDGDEVEQFISCGNSLTSTFKQPENVKFLNNLPVFKYENDGNTTYKGVPIFAIDVTNSIIFQEWLSGLANVGVSTSMSDTLTFTKNEASLFSYSKMYLDWLMRNQYCPGCGSKVIPIDSGTRLQCTGPPDTCPVKSTNVNNVCFPRTDPVIIVGIISNDGSKILLGHNKRHQPTSNGKLMYSCIAGFMEPGETIEEATIREIWEETGVKASKVKLIQSQPWPFPANLMIGCIGIVEFNNDFELINLEFDKELDVCKWFDCNDVLNHINGVDVDGLDHFMLPMSNSIAYQLILKSIKGELTN